MTRAAALKAWRTRWQKQKVSAAQKKVLQFLATEPSGRVEVKYYDKGRFRPFHYLRSAIWQHDHRLPVAVFNALIDRKWIKQISDRANRGNAICWEEDGQWIRGQERISTYTLTDKGRAALEGCT